MNLTIQSWIVVCHSTNITIRSINIQIDQSFLIEPIWSFMSKRHQYSWKYQSFSHFVSAYKHDEGTFSLKLCKQRDGNIWGWENNP